MTDIEIGFRVRVGVAALILSFTGGIAAVTSGLLYINAHLIPATGMAVFTTMLMFTSTWLLSLDDRVIRVVQWPEDAPSPGDFLVDKKDDE